MSDLHTATLIADADLIDTVEFPVRKAAATGLLKATFAKLKTYLLTTTKFVQFSDVDVSTPPTDGQALVYNATATKWKPGSVAAGGGGGGSGSTTITAPLKDRFAPPATTAFPTVVNAAGTTAPRFVTNAGGATVLGYNESPTVTGDKWKMRLKTAPTGKVMIARLQTLYPETNFSGGGLVLRNSTSGKFHQFGAFFDNTSGPITLRAMSWTNETTFSANITIKTGIQAKEWFKVDWSDGTNVKFYISADAVDWVQVATTTLAGFIGSIDQVGFGINENYQSTAGLNGTETATNRPEAISLNIDYYQDSDITPTATGFTGAGGGTTTQQNVIIGASEMGFATASGVASAGYWFGHSMIVPFDCTISQVRFWAMAAAATTTIEPAIYTVNSAGQAAVLLAGGPIVTGVVQGENQIPLATPLTLTAGTKLFVGVIARVNSITVAAGDSTNGAYFPVAGASAPTNPTGFTTGGNFDTAWLSGTMTLSGGGGGTTAAASWNWAFTGTPSPSAITGSTTATLGAGSVNAALQNASKANYFWFNAGQSGQSVTFDLGAAYVLSGILGFQDIAGSQGTWQAQYSDDGVTYTNIGTPVVWSAVTNTWTFTNSTAHRYWRLLQTTGTTASTPWQQGFMFRWGAA